MIFYSASVAFLQVRRINREYNTIQYNTKLFSGVFQVRSEDPLGLCDSFKGSVEVQLKQWLEVQLKDVFSK